MKNAQNSECGLTPKVREAIAWAQAEAGYEVPVSGLLSPLRMHKYVRIRRLAAWRLRVQHRFSYPRIAAALHRSDHTSAMHLVETENIARGLPRNYPINEWRAQTEQALTCNIDLITEQLDAGQDPDDVAYAWGISTVRMLQSVQNYRRQIGEKPENQQADERAFDRIGSDLEGVGA